MNMTRISLAVLAVLLATGLVTARLSARSSPPADARGGAERKAITAGLGILEKSAQQWPAGCVSCHHQALQLITSHAARRSGYKIDDSFLHHQQDFIQSSVAKSQTKMIHALESDQIPVAQVGPNPDMIFGYSLFGLAQTDVLPNPITDTAVRYLLRIQGKRGNWESRLKQRPPFEASDFTATALAVRVIREYAPSDSSSEAHRAVRAAATWFRSADPADNEDRAFLLLGLHWIGSGKEDTDNAIRALVAQQRPDGGWAQTSWLPSDAYATGETLVALRTAGVSETDPAFRRGIDFLLQTQHQDGSWYVKSRAKPIQEYFESGFPYGKDQFISYAATCWATLAILSDNTFANGGLN